MSLEDRIVSFKSSTAYIDSDEVSFTILFESHSRSKKSSRVCLRGQDHRFRFFAFNPVNSHRTGSPAKSQAQQFYFKYVSAKFVSISVFAWGIWRP